MGDFTLHAVVGFVTLQGGVDLLRAQGKPASLSSLRRWLRRNGVPLARIGRTIMVDPAKLTNYKHGR